MRSLKNRICSFKTFREKFDPARYIKSKDRLGITGIPQGTTISGMLANIFMIDFDLHLKKVMGDMRGFYRRYSDDIFVIFPKSKTFLELEDLIKLALIRFSSNSLVINDSKTVRSIYTEDPDGDAQCQSIAYMRSPIQYLGFSFDGSKKHIRSSTISKSRQKIVKTIRKHKKDNKAGFKAINTRQVYKSQSSREITPYERKGFINYAQRASKKLGAPEIVSQVEKNDQFIKNQIIIERRK